MSLNAKTTRPEAYMRILIVDDSEDSRDITEAALFSAGYTNIATAHSARDAYQAARYRQGRQRRRPRTPTSFCSTS